MDQPIIWYKGLTKLDFHIINVTVLRYINLKYNTIRTCITISVNDLL